MNYLIGPVLMINGLDTLNCNNMIFWYDRDSIQASGKVKFNFGDSQLNSDSLIYVKLRVIEVILFKHEQF